MEEIRVPFEKVTPEGVVTGLRYSKRDGDREVFCRPQRLRLDGEPIDDQVGIALLERYGLNPCR